MRFGTLGSFCVDVKQLVVPAVLTKDGVCTVVSVKMRAEM